MSRTLQQLKSMLEVSSVGLSVGVPGVVTVTNADLAASPSSLGLEYEKKKA